MHVLERLTLVSIGVVAFIGYREWRAEADRCAPSLCVASDVKVTKTKFVVANVLALSGLVTGTIGALLFFVFSPSSAAHAIRPNGVLLRF
jgi:hypothetical protein